MVEYGTQWMEKMVWTSSFSLWDLGSEFSYYLNFLVANQMLPFVKEKNKQKKVKHRWLVSSYINMSNFLEEKKVRVDLLDLTFYFT